MLLSFAKRRQVLAYDATHKIIAPGLIELRNCRTWPARKRVCYKWAVKAFELGHMQAESMSAGVSSRLSLGFWDGLKTAKEYIAATVSQMVDTAQKYSKHAGTVAAANIETVLRTAAHTFYSAGQWVANDSNPDVLAYRYQTVGDDRVRDNHAEVEGVTLSKENEFWTYGLPPNGYNCRCIVVPIYGPYKRVEPPEGWQPDPGFGDNDGKQILGKMINDEF
jgi:SPP1 gp7 family putative phage head morphogenesis protein